VTVSCIGLLHCRHLKTVRTHLSGLVNAAVIESLDSAKRLTEDVWRSFHSGSDVSLENKQINVLCSL